MKETKDLLRTVGIIVLALIVLVVVLPFVLVLLHVAVGILVWLAITVIKVAIVVAVFFFFIVGIRSVLRWTPLLLFQHNRRRCLAPGSANQPLRLPPNADP